MARKNTAEKQIATILDYKKTFSTDFGQRVLNDLMETHHFLGPVMDKDLNNVLFREGARNVVIRILKFMEMDPEKIRRRIKEIENEHS